MSEDNRDQSITTGQAFVLSAMIVGLAMLAFVVVRWMLTTRVGAIVGMIATLVFLAFLFSDLDGQVAAGNTTAAPGIQRNGSNEAASKSLLESGNRPSTNDGGSSASMTVRPADNFPTTIRRSGDSVCVTVGSSTNCQPLR